MTFMYAILVGRNKLKARNQNQDTFTMKESLDYMEFESQNKKLETGHLYT